jgi:hypothetical protein
LHDQQKIEHFYDIEVNALIQAIAKRTGDLTVVLDCCHSAGATRDLEEAQGQDRALGDDPTPVAPPDLAALGLPGPSAAQASRASILQTFDPNYVVVVACQPEQKAGEGKWPTEPKAQGVFTYALVNLLRDKTAEQRAELRWADIWPAMLEGVAARCDKLNRRPQNPWIIGRSERRIFGGDWEEQDVGYRVTRQPDGRYIVEAGTLMGLTQGAEVAVYGPKPPRFPEIGSAEDQPCGRLRVTEAQRASCIAEPVGAAFDPGQGARGRLVKPGESECLNVALKPHDAGLAAALAKSSLLKVLPDGAIGEVEVVAEANGDWAIGNDVEELLARVPVGETTALRAGLESYYRYNTVLRMAHNCSDPPLSNALNVSLLDCSDTAALAAMTPEERADPRLPELDHDTDGVYIAPKGIRCCIKLSNRSPRVLRVAVLDCTSGGKVQYLGDTSLRADQSDIIWFKSEIGNGFPISAGAMPPVKGGAEVKPYVTDRVVVIGTTRQDVDLHYLTVRDSVQDVVDRNTRAMRGDRDMLDEIEAEGNAPSELWTATITPLRIFKA